MGVGAIASYSIMSDVEKISKNFTKETPMYPPKNSPIQPNINIEPVNPIQPTPSIMPKNNPKNVIWIDPNIDNQENTGYLEYLKTIANTKSFKNVNKALDFIKTIKFSETNIIISGSLYAEFIEKFEENLTDIFIIPKIIVFTSNKEKFIEYNKNYNDKYISFYNLGGIQTKFDDVRNFLLNPLPKPINKKVKIKEEQLTFEYIDRKEKLVLPLLYKSLIEETSIDNIEKFTEYLHNKYSTNKEINILLNSIQNIPDIPTELLTKYYIRIFTADSQFHNDINQELRGNEKYKYLPYIKLLYEGLKLKSLPIASNNLLYRGSKISNNEIKKINRFLKNKKNGLPGGIVFSRSYLSFSKIRKVAEDFLNRKNENGNENEKNISKVIYIIEKDDKIDYSLSTHCDIEKISMYPEEKEVLFFPFSSFEIQDINEIMNDKEKIYEIKLLYLGKYLKEIENLDENIPDSDFKKEMIESGLIPERKMEKTKEVINQYNEFKINIEKNNNEINITYNSENKDDVHIFGKKFVENNKDKCKIVFKNKEYELKENFHLKDYTNDKLNKLQIKLINIKNITNMSYMFSDCQLLSSLPDISIWKTNNITDMSYMFYYCGALSSLPDISKWNTNNVTDMSNMFNNCTSLLSLPDISKWNTSKVTNMSYMFNDCTLLSLPDISMWNTNNVTDMSNMFNNCASLLSLPDISKWNTNNVTDMSYMFNECTLLSLPDISNWNTNNATNMSYMFNNCTKLSSLPDISNWNTNNVTNVSNIFNNCSTLSSLPDISNWETNSVTDMSNLFSNCTSLLSIPDISKWSINNATDISSLFYNCSSLSSLPDISNWNTNKITNMSSIFYNCKKISSLPDISIWITKNVTSISYIFYNCVSLSSLPDISNWNTNNFTIMSNILYNCNKLSSLPDISKWNTNNVTDMSYMFYSCTSLISLPDISKWNINKVTNMSNMFYYCKELSSLPDISIWNTENVTDMSYMFYGCIKLSPPDITKWNTKNVTNMNYIFNI